MDNRQILRECAENLALLTQLGCSVAAPPILCLYAAAWLRGRFALGLWIMAIGLLLGLGGSAVSAWKFWKLIRRRFDREPKQNSGPEGPEEIGGEKHQD